MGHCHSATCARCARCRIPGEAPLLFSCCAINFRWAESWKLRLPPLMHCAKPNTELKSSHAGSAGIPDWRNALQVWPLALSTSSVQSPPSYPESLSLIADQIPWEGPSKTCIMKYQEIRVAEVHKWKEEELRNLGICRQSQHPK